MAGYNTTVQTPVANTPITFDFPAANTIRPEQLFFVLYNQSPFVCVVQTEFDTQFCAAFTADVYVVERTPRPRIIVTPISNLGADDPIASQVFGTWYTQREDIPLTTVPASLFGSTDSIAVDNPVTLLSGTAQDTTPFYTSALFDTRRYLSYQLYIEYNAANAGPPGNTLIVRLEWYSDLLGGALLHQNELEINSMNSTDCGPVIITDSMHGAFMRLVMFTGNGPNSTATFRLVGSNRPQANLRIVEIGDGGSAGQGSDQALVLLGNISVPAATTTRRNCRLGHGRATFFVRTSAAGGPWGIDLHSPDIGSTLPYWTANVPAGANFITTPITAPRRALTLVIANTHATLAGIIWVSLVVDNE
jgi:hypothetical protein